MSLLLRIRHSYQSNWKKETLPLADSPLQAVPPVPLSADSCVVCHLEQAEEGGTRPREHPKACLDTILAQRPRFYLSGLRILIHWVTVYLWWCTNAWLSFVAFSTSMLGIHWSPFYLFQRQPWTSAQTFSFLLAPIIGNFLYVGLSGEVLRCSHFTRIALVFWGLFNLLNPLLNYKYQWSDNSFI